jgi:hypothetical protein
MISTCRIAINRWQIANSVGMCCLLSQFHQIWKQPDIIKNPACSCATGFKIHIYHFLIPLLVKRNNRSFLYDQFSEADVFYQVSNRKIKNILFGAE